MSANLFRLQPRPGVDTAGRREPLDEAVLEVSGRIASLNTEKRRLFSRLGELGSGRADLMRSHPRPAPPDPRRPLTIYSIEEAAPEAPERQARRA